MKITLVTGLWNIGRGEMNTSFERGFDHYLECFSKVLNLDVNLIVFGDSELKKFVQERRSDRIQFIDRELEWFRNEFYDRIQEIRNDKEWINQVGWLGESTQGKLEMYNPLVMSKMMLLHDAKILDRFNSDFLYWIDAGLSNTVTLDTYVTQDTLQKISSKINSFLFVAFPFIPNTEIHGFKYPEITKYTEGKDINLVGRGGFFGGRKDSIGEVFGHYYQLLGKTLEDGYMGTEESIFSIMIYKLPNLVSYHKIEDNGLVYKLFQDAIDDNLQIIQQKKKFKQISKIGLYVITFNSPNQFKKLVKSIELYDRKILEGEKFLLNNSTDKTTTKEYESLCKKHNFTHIQPGKNIGICGGRQFIAEHFNETDLDGYFFFEDDMFFYPKEGEVCKNGFNRYSKNLYKNSLNIIKKRNFDFLKLSFTEFFGDNITQWAWYNVPQNFREKHWPEKPNLPVQGFDSNAPKTKFNKIGSHNGLAYADGEIYYSNWPQVVSKYGNKKMFLTEKWARPYEQTWMSYIFQKTVEKEINPAILLLTPTEHDRFDHYDKKIRKES